MNNEKDLLKSYVLNERNFNSAKKSTNEKALAWRTQALLLQDLSRNATKSIQYDLMEQHFMKSRSNRYDFIKERTEGVHELLKGKCPKRAINSMEDEFPELDETILQSIDSSTTDYEENEICFNLPQSETTQTKPFLNGSQQQQHQPNSAVNRTVEKEPTSTINETVPNAFRTAREELIVQNIKRNGAGQSTMNSFVTKSTAASTAVKRAPLFSNGTGKKYMGTRRTVASTFVTPVAEMESTQKITPSPPEDVTDERLANIDPKMVALITSEIMHKYKPISWNEIAGLEYAKSVIKETVVYPMLRPDIFTGLRRPPRGILLFGPPGTGKTLIGKCIAAQSQSTFFSISASSLTSKWIGDGEKMVRALFAVAAVHQPSVVFIDEIDSLLSQRSETEHESSRRLKNEFLIQLDGAATSEDDRIVIVGATNRPQELDEAARRRLVRRLYIPLPELEARIQILNNLLKTVPHCLTENEINEIGRLTDGFSGADVDTICREASMEPIRSIPADQIPNFSAAHIRAVGMQDFHSALRHVRPSVSQADLQLYTKWNQDYGAAH